MFNSLPISTHLANVTYDADVEDNGGNGETGDDHSHSHSGRYCGPTRALPLATASFSDDTTDDSHSDSESKSESKLESRHQFCASLHLNAASESPMPHRYHNLNRTAIVGVYGSNDRPIVGEADLRQYGRRWFGHNVVSPPHSNVNDGRPTMTLASVSFSADTGDSRSHGNSDT